MFKPLPDGRIELSDDFVCVIENGPNHSHTITVPKGFKSDGASIPRCFWWLIGPPIGNVHLIPAIVHDYLCATATTRNKRLIGDAVFRHLLEEYSVPKWKRAFMFLSVYVQGRFLWVPKVAKVAKSNALLILFLLAVAGVVSAMADEPDDADAHLQRLSQQQERGELENNMRAIPGRPLPKPRVVLGSCRFHSVYDADTVRVSVTRIVKVRFDGCWAPEVTERGNHVSEKTLGIEARESLKKMISPGDLCRLEIMPDGDESFGDQITFSRVVAHVYPEDGDGRSLGEVLNQKGLTFETKAELEDYLTERDKDERFVQ